MESGSGRLCFTTHHRYGVFYRLEVCGHPAQSKSIGTIFPKAFTHFISLYHILAVLEIFQTLHHPEDFDSESSGDGYIFLSNKVFLITGCTFFRHAAMAHLTDYSLVETNLCTHWETKSLAWPVLLKYSFYGCGVGPTRRIPNALTGHSCTCKHRGAGCTAAAQFLVKWKENQRISGLLYRTTQRPPIWI